jgi:RHS repeat-associated protein
MPDQLGSVRDVIDATSGSLVASYDYTPYGAVARSSVTNGTDYQYAKLFYHTNSGLNLSATRAIDPVTGRWINRDPIRELGGINLYAYVDANTINATDPKGLQMAPTVEGGSAIFGGGAATAGEGGVIAGCTTNPIGAVVCGTVAVIVVGGICYVAYQHYMAKPTGKEKSTDYPSWVNQYQRDPNEDCQAFAASILDNKYGAGNWNTGPGSEYSKIVKACQRGGLK